MIILGEIITQPFLTFLLSIVLLFIPHFLSKWFSDKHQKKGRSIWIDFLKSNKSINDCIIAVRFTEQINNIFFNFIESIFGFILCIIIVFSFSILYPNTEQFLSHLSIINYFLFILTLLFSYFIAKSRNNNTIVTQSEKLYFYFDRTIWGAVGFYLFFMVFIYLGLKTNVFQFEDLLNNKSIRDSLIVLIISFILVCWVRTKFISIIKDEFNKHYLNKFPFIQITTTVGENYGKIQNIFHEDLVILEECETKTAVHWSEIKVLKLFNYCLMDTLRTNRGDTLRGHR